MEDFLLFIAFLLTSLASSDGYVCSKPLSREPYNYLYEDFDCPFGCCGPTLDHHCCIADPGPIVGIVIGIVIFIAAIVLGIFCYKTKCRYCPLHCKPRRIAVILPMAVTNTQNQMNASNGYPLSAYGNAGSETTPFGFTNYGHQPPLGDYTANTSQDTVFTYSPSTLT
uniref:Vesicular, overexpressed in cancer, prosurvival protein 1 n=1 Tax=Biomphalaria glabrata TaxID=6526 RepID=A0A2C9LWY8_BIOGL